MHGRISLFGFTCLAFLGGCSEAPDSIKPEEQPIALAQSFDPSATGTVRGRVRWDGEVPLAKEALIRASAFNPYLHQKPARVVTPHIPKVNPKDRGVENAVVFLRGIDPRRSKPWDHAKVNVEFHDRQLRIEQGKHRSNLGFVRSGSAIEIVNRDTEYHNLQGRGAAFFAMPLMEPNQLQERRLTQTGIVDLTCGAGYYWLHAHLFVVGHPYYVRTDVEGRFVLDQVPAGTYEIVCWLPNWNVASREFDPETGIIARLRWASPREQMQTVQIIAGQESEITYRWTQGMFD